MKFVGKSDKKRRQSSSWEIRNERLKQIAFYIFKYASNQEIREDYYKMVVEKYLKKGYNEYEAQIEALKESVKKFDIMVKR